MTSQFGYSLCVCACTRFVSCSSNKISESSSQSLKHNMMSRSPKQGGKTCECILISGNTAGKGCDSLLLPRS